MKKFLLVTFVGIVLAINLYSITTNVIEMIKENQKDNNVATIVYVE